MDRVLAVPNFSTPFLPDDLGLPPWVTLHYAKGDVDHGRSVVAFSGKPDHVLIGLVSLAHKFLQTIDLSEQTGVHPRIGAIDVVPLIDLQGHKAERIAHLFAGSLEVGMGIPVLKYERSSREGKTLPELRRASWPGHPKWGATVVGARDFLIAANLDFPSAVRTQVANAAREIRHRRDAGDPALEGVRALAFHLVSRDEVQLSFNLTRPDVTSFDAVASLGEEFVGQRARSTELIGVIRRRDLSGATRLEVAPEQIVD